MAVKVRENTLPTERWRRTSKVALHIAQAGQEAFSSASCDPPTERHAPPDRRRRSAARRALQRRRGRPGRAGVGLRVGVQAVQCPLLLVHLLVVPQPVEHLEGLICRW
jgi:hypothetical protein